MSKVIVARETLISLSMGVVFDRLIFKNKASRLKLVTLDRSGKHAFGIRYITNSLYCYYKLGLNS